MADEQVVRIGLVDVTLFKESIATINGLVVEANISLDDIGLSIMALDAANVAMCNFRMRKEEFTEWSVPIATDIGLKLSDLRQALGRATEKSATLILEYSNSKLKVILTAKNGKKKEFSLGTIDLSATEKKKVPDLKFGAEVLIDNTVFKDCIQDVAVFAESVVFNVNTKKFFVSGSGDSNGTKSEVEAVVTCTDEKGFVSKYSIEYLDKFTTSKVSKVVKVSFGKDYPVKLTYLNDKSTASMEFILAPRIENI